jgi:hypothetical protein
VDQPGHLTEAHRHTGLGQTGGIGQPLVPQGVQIGHHEHGGREAVEVGGPQRTGVGLGASIDVRQVVVPEPAHLRGPQDHPLVGDVGRPGEVGVQHGVEQQLAGQSRAILVPGPQRAGRGQRATGAVARDDERPPAGEFAGRPPECPEGVLQGGREGMLRGQPVVHGQHLAPGADGQVPTQRVAVLEVAGHPTPAVQVHHRGGRLGVVGSVEPPGDRGAAHGDLDVPDVAQVRAGSAQRGPGADPGARVLGREPRQRRRAGRRGGGEQLGDLGVERRRVLRHERLLRLLGSSGGGQAVRKPS